ncbi:MAG TPA: sigma factor, partial [Gammaproteobacteria bacterium]|nr:sigma factor [Gammaproteobacteria bacterium]
MTTALVMKQFLVPSNIAGWEGYLAKVNAIPLLSQEEEFSLADRFQREGDLLSAEKLVLSHLRYVVRVAKGYMGYGLQLPDLVQEGTIGLMKAVKRFDPHMGVRLVS